jgi:hypothetical protein
MKNKKKIKKRKEIKKKKKGKKMEGRELKTFFV